ncbi:MAG: chemotaxis protein CheR [Candidatus Melainabacteria bacterium HGW-Melainabacteria-1]|nr:MAG: chemotaxis protein CheR [Candidatus Melainabacteria bacterium HGW-Melainabacteria-1]
MSKETSIRAAPPDNQEPSGLRPGPSDELIQLEIQLLLEGIYQYYGLDFRQYAPKSLRRRIQKLIDSTHLDSISSLQARVLHDPAWMERLMGALTISVTSLFRDPVFYRALRDKVLSVLAEQSLVKIWIAGCATGEEVYSLAILLEEAGLYDRCRIYATDLNPKLLEQAKAGIFPIQVMAEYSRNYLQAGGRRTLSHYYTARSQHAIFHASLRRNVVFAQHNLVTDRSFNVFELILCRNVLIYFQPELQAQVHRLFYDSLDSEGFLALGMQESLSLTPHEAKYQACDEICKIYLKQV